MIKALRHLFLILAAAFAVTAMSKAAPVHPAADAARAWGFDRSDLAPHPGVRFGVLANGMRYALMRNAVPTAGLAVRMRVGAGAAMEGARERGAMHLVEHLIFQGSKNLPPSALPLMLRREGLKRNDDFSAVTGFDETVYRLDLPRADPRARATAMTVMREVAGHLSFDRKLVERARRSVRDELASQDTVRERLIAAQDAFFMPGTAVARGPVGGSARSIDRLGGTILQDLYARHYVPANTTLVVVGDIDPDAVEREIAGRFAGWRAGDGTGVAARRPSPPLQVQRGIVSRFFVDPAAETSVSIVAAEPLGGTDADNRRRTSFLEHLGSEMLSRRLTRVASRPEAPIAGGWAAVYDYFSAARIARVDLAARGRDWRGALRAGWYEFASALMDGFSQDELDQQLAVSRAALTRDAGMRTSSALGDAIIDAINRRLVFTAPGDAAATAAYLSQIRLEPLNAAFKRAWAAPSRRIFVSHNAPVPGAEAEITGEWISGRNTASTRERPARN